MGDALGGALSPLGITPALTAGPAVTDVLCTATLGLIPGLVVTQAISGSLTDTTNITTTPTTTWGYVVRETVRLLETMTPAAKYQVLAGNLVALRETLLAGRPVSMTENLTLTATLGVLRAIMVAETLGLHETFLGALVSRQTVTETLQLHDALARFLSGLVTENIAVTEELISQALVKADAAENLAVTATLTPKLLLRVDAHETLQISATQALKMVWSGQVLEGIELHAGYVAPNGNFSTWAMNTRTAAVTEYSNFVFNGFAKLGDRYIGTSDTGVYELTGNTDAGASIVARLKSGYMQFGGTHLSRLKEAYIAARGHGQYVLKIIDGDGSQYVYRVDARDMRSTKVHMGKGQRSRYFSFELTSSGQDFDIDTLEFVPVEVQRRV